MLIAVTAACGGTPPSAEATVSRAGEPAGNALRTAPRAIAPRATAPRAALADRSSPTDFGAWVGLLRAALEAERDESIRSTSATPCLLRRNGDALRSMAESAPAIRPVPDPPTALRGGPGEPVQVLSRFGLLGDAVQHPARAFAALTPHRRPRGAVVLLYVVDAEVIVWCVEGPCASPAPGTEQDLLDEETLAQSAVDGALVFVTATARVPLRRLENELTRLPAGVEVALAVELPEGTRLPTADDVDDLRMPRPDGATDRADDTRCNMETFSDLAARAGDYPDPGVLVASFRAAEARLALCLRYGEGGRLSLRFRVDPQGRVTEGCIDGGGAEERTLRRCVLGALREHAFPPPPEAGAVDVALPLTLEAPRGPPVHGMCP